MLQTQRRCFFPVKVSADKIESKRGNEPERGRGKGRERSGWFLLLRFNFYFQFQSFPHLYMGTIRTRRIIR